MTTITDEYMRESVQKTRNYSVVILKYGPDIKMPGVEKIIWEHARRNFSLRADGILSVVCPISDGSGVSGLGIFKGGVDEVAKVMEEDPGVKAGVFVYELHECRSFPGDMLPK